MLVHLDQRLHRRAERRVGRGGDGREHEAAARVRVVRDREDVAAGEPIQALALERRPQPLRRRLLHVARRQRRDDGVPEDDVPVKVVAAGLAAPLVGDEGRERAGGRAVVELLGRRLRVLPDERRLREAVDAVGSAPGESLRRVHVAVREQERDHRERRQQARERRQRRGELIASRDTVARVVARKPGREADLDLAELLRVVGDRSEVERPAELRGARRHALGVVRREADRLALREPVGAARVLARAGEDRVRRVGGVHVRVPEVRLAELLEARAGLARFRPLPGAGHAVRVRGDEREKNDHRHSLVCHDPILSANSRSQPVPRSSASTARPSSGASAAWLSRSHRRHLP